jgi:tripartite ATP-independent transporter DctM subunit
MAYLGSYVWIALPLFVMLGGLLSDIGVSKRVVWLGEYIGRRIRGGTSQVLVIISLFLGGMTGSALAEAGMLSVMFRKDMEKAGYHTAYLAGLITCAGLIGSMIPPSNILLILGLAGEISVIRLWLGGIGPGILTAIGLMIASALTQGRYELKEKAGRNTVKEKADQERQGSFLTALPGLAVPIVILAGMRLGIFTPVEAGASGIIYALILGVTLFRRELTLAHLADSISRNLLSAMSYLFLVSGAAVFGVLVVRLNLTEVVEKLFIAWNFNAFQFMLANFALYFIMGMFIEAVPIMLIFFPLMLPAARSLGIDPIHFGVSFSMIILLANLTPPIGVTMLFVCRLLDTNVYQWWKHGKYFFLVVLLVTFAVMFIPEVSLFIPSLIMD